MYNHNVSHYDMLGRDLQYMDDDPSLCDQKQPCLSSMSSYSVFADATAGGDESSFLPYYDPSNVSTTGLSNVVSNSYAAAPKNMSLTSHSFGVGYGSASQQTHCPDVAKLRQMTNNRK